ncbi:MAG TPA: FtsX-like permease family protein [Fluviicola sp.]|nr:FtsX-like permease family protein [Fluviicola sp.]
MHLITRISVIGITITTAALVILIAAFNGIEGMVERLYSSYDAPLTIRSEKGKTFKENSIDLAKIKQVEGVAEVSRAVEETVILKHQKKWVNAQMVGVDLNFLKTCEIEKHIVDGYPSLEENGKPTAIIGASLLDKLDGFIAEANGYEQLMLYTPLRDASISRRKNPFKTTALNISSRMNYNREVNSQFVLMPLNFAQEQLNYDGEITALYLGVDPKTDAFDVKERLQKLLGPDFKVKTAAEKNELIYKTSQSEKRIVIIILVFVFILAAFNLIASLTMLFIEKKDNIQTMSHFGASNGFVFRIFFFEGLLIAGKGIVIGLVLGTAVCLTQQFGKLLEMPNSGGEPFPIEFTVQDGLLIIILVSTLSAITAFLPVYYLVKRASR